MDGQHSHRPLSSNGSDTSRAAPAVGPLSDSSSQSSLKAKRKASVTVTRLESRSASTGAIQSLLRPVRSRLVKIKEQPGGSIPLEAPQSVLQYCTVHQRTVAGINIYDINVRSESTDRYVSFTDTAKTMNLGVQPSSRASSWRLRSTNSPSFSSSSSSSSLRSTPSSTAQPQVHKPSHLSSVMTNTPTPPATEDHRDPILESVIATRTEAPSIADTPPPTISSSSAMPSTPDLNHFPPLTRGHTDPQVRTKDWALHHDGERRKRPRQIYYFAGGSWQMPPTKEHWKLCTELARQLTARGTHTTVSMVSQPLAPKSAAAEAFPMLEELYYELFPQAGTGNLQAVLGNAMHAASAVADTTNGNGSSISSPPGSADPEVILAGDSSGANVALALTLHMLSRDEAAPAPASLMLLSPAVDMRTDNPSLAKLDRKDPVSSLKAVQQAHAAWRGGNRVDETDPRVSPIMADLSLLRRRRVHVNGVNAGYDLLSADVRRFLARMEEEGVVGRWLDWEKQMHVFPLTFSYGLEEGKKGVDWILNCIDSPLSRATPSGPN